MPCFSSRRCAWRRTSPSMPGRTPSRNSTTVTFEPSRRHTEPSSSPITPAPITSKLFRHLVEHQRAGRRHDALLVDLDAFEPGDVGAGGDHDGFGFERLCLAVGAFDFDLAGRGDAAGAVKGIDLVFLEQKLDALDVAVDALVLERHHRFQVELGLRKRRYPSCRSCGRLPRTIPRRAAAPSTGCSRR